MSSKFKPQYPRMAQLKTVDDVQNYLAEHQIDLPFDAELLSAAESPFAHVINLNSGKTIGNSLCILPMEGWDGTRDGRASVHTIRRWEKFAISGAKLLWGGEAVAVTPEGRANPNQLMLNEDTYEDIKGLFNMVMEKHQEKFGNTSDLVLGLQLTHSGRFCKPNDHKKYESITLYKHPMLDQKFNVADDAVMSDEEIDELIQKYVKAAVLAQKAGYHFVDLKHCHGYLGHEFLSAIDREGKYGGSFENRTRFLRNLVAGIKEAAPGLEMGVRLSAYDLRPFKKGDDQVGVPDMATGDIYPYTFGGSKDGLSTDLEETKKFMAVLQELGIQLVCITGGSPYYNPHVTRPALFPPSDGYQPPEDPLIGVNRMIRAAAELKTSYPDLVIVGSGYSYLQEWLPNVAQHVLNNKMADSVGFGRMVLSYPDMPDDMLHARPHKRNMICRTFSDCTTAPRNGIISGCYPLDKYYKEMPEAEELKALK